MWSLEAKDTELIPPGWGNINTYLVVLLDEGSRLENTIYWAYQTEIGLRRFANIFK